MLHMKCYWTCVFFLSTNQQMLRQAILKDPYEKNNISPVLVMRYHLLVIELFQKNYKKKSNIMLFDTMYQSMELWSSRGLSQSTLNMSLA